MAPPPRGQTLRARLVQVAMGVDSARQNQLARSVYGAQRAGHAVATVPPRIIRSNSFMGKSVLHQDSMPSSRCDQNVVRFSSNAKMAYMITPMTDVTISPEKTSGVSKFDVAAIIK